MKTRPSVRHTAQEKAIVAASNRVLANEAATPAEIATALKAIHRAKTTAQQRARDNAKASTAKDPADSVDALVQELEKPKATAAEPEPEPEPKAAESLDGLMAEMEKRAIPAKLAESAAGPEKASPECPVSLIRARCSDSDSADDPRDTTNSIKPFQYDYDAMALQAAAKAAWHAQGGTHADLQVLRNAGSDYDRSVDIWRQEIQNEQFERDSLLRQIDQNRRKQSF